MDADFSIELGRNDPVLDLPWTDPSGKVAYVDLKRHPELLEQIAEAQAFPELGEFLRTMNSASIAMETAKCDAWATMDLNAEEAVYDASHKSASYVDVLFSNDDARQSFARHETFARQLVDLLRRTPEADAAAEVCVRRCYLQEIHAEECFYFTLYVAGYGDDEASALRHWTAGLRQVADACRCLSANHPN